ncbi:ATP-binding protein [Flavobacterium enshiense]|uniref:sensor histidine kinase n=1 Tax=Flavobacterium enshiense TaxID=1341165 RepID=UPI00345D3354
MQLFKILCHDLRGPVSSLIQLQQVAGLVDKKTNDKLKKKAIHKTEKLLYFMEDLLLWGKGQMVNFTTQSETICIDSLFKYAEKHFSDDEEITFSFHNPEKLMLFTDHDFVKTILRNLTANALAFTKNLPNPLITFKAWSDEYSVYISVFNNGEAKNFNRFNTLYHENDYVNSRSGLGLHLIRDLAQIIDCKLSTNFTEEGTTIKLTFEKQQLN